MAKAVSGQNTMGIHGLAKLIADQAPSAIKEQDIKSYFGNYQHLKSNVFVTLWLKRYCDSPLLLST